MRALVASGAAPGVLAYVDGELAGWCAIEPREAFGQLARSRVLAPVDGEPVWSIACLYVAKEHRRTGLSKRILAAAAEYAASRGARVVEGYPVEPRQASMPDVFAYTGIASAFEAAGFEEVARRSPTRPIFRKRVARARSRRRAAT
jgi:GNAT superfamily N-acetyltransferase